MKEALESAQEGEMYKIYPEINVYKPTEYVGDWRDKTYVGFIVSMVVAVTFLLIFCLVPSLVHSYHKVAK